MNDYTDLIHHVTVTLSDAARCHSLGIEPAWYGLERDLGAALAAMKTMHAENANLRNERDALQQQVNDVCSERVDYEVRLLSAERDRNADDPAAH